MRIITHLGFGRIDTDTLPSRLSIEPIEVKLEQPFLGKQIVHLSRQEVFQFGVWAIIRILNVGGVGILSNLLFFPSKKEALDYFETPSPPDETRFLVDNLDGSVESDQILGFGTGEFLIVRPWINCWAPERSSMFESQDEAIAGFDDEKSLLAGTSGGISATALFSTRDGKILRFSVSIAPPQGIILEYLFPNKLLTKQ